MQHHLARLLPSSTSAAAFSTSKHPYARRTNPTPPPPAEKPGDDAAGMGPCWQRERLPSELPRPATIPFQPRVANDVRLVGAPVELQRMPDGRFSAVSVLVQNRRTDFPKFWIPVIFQDDLAQVAASPVSLERK